MKRNELLDILSRKSKSFHITGSRFICDPPVLNTDEDYIVLVKNPEAFDFDMVNTHVFETSYGEYAHPDGDYSFLSYRNGEFNLIVTGNEKLYYRFVAATFLAKELNLTKKEDRIELFEKIVSL